MPPPSRRGLVALTTLTLLAAVSAGVAPAVDADAAPAVDADTTRAVETVDIVPANRSTLSGIHTIQVGTRMLVRGTTNRRPDRSAIDVEVVDGPDADRIGFVVVEEWGSDGVWTAELTVPADATPGTYTLRVAVGDEADYQDFEVVAEKRATLTVREVAADRVVVDATLPDGGYVEIRADTVRGVSPYLGPGTHRSVSIPVESPPSGVPSLTAVAVVGTPDRRLDPYTWNGTAVTATVRLPADSTPTTTATVTPTPTATSTPRAATATTTTTTPTTTLTVTDGAGPGFDAVVALVALCFLLYYGRLQ
jgi:hypothetical protein